MLLRSKSRDSIQRRFRAGGADSPTRPRLSSEREEILRLIARLGETRRWEEDGSGPALGDRLASLIDHASPRRSYAPGPRPRLSSELPSASRRSGSNRLTQRRRELEEIKRLQARIEADRPRLADRLRGFEQRLDRIEGRMSSSSRSAAPPSKTSPGGGTWTFQGIIQGEILSDMLQLVSSNKMTGVFIVKESRMEHTLYFNEGQICHAVAGDLIGENAFYSAFAVTEGEYFFREAGEFGGERTINSDTQFLILEALRRIDELHAGQDE